ncbi:MAG: MOSC N-terminal beta barrel domain-containing protein [Synechocystis sp.]|nr:MOSC N-terminal beta barrel domain-containing protein [Synechocystis sp.]
MQVSGLFIYPIKSCRGIALERVTVLEKGFAYDREFMLVDEQGNFLTQRQYPRLATIQVSLSPTHLHLSTANHHPFSLPLTVTGTEKPVTVWRDRVIALDQGDQVAEWFQQALGLDQSVRLVRQSPDYPRPVDPNFRPQADNTVSFADGFPILVTNTASLAELNQRIATNQGQPVGMDRFRPNLVIQGDRPFAETDWQRLQIAQVQLDLVKPCSRCIVTTTDQHTGDRREEKPLADPLATLSQFRNVPGQGILFGENAVPHRLGDIALGDRVMVLK